MGQPYGGIVFRKDYKDFAEFKKELENTHVFKAIPHKKRDAELKKAFKLATKDGKFPNSSSESKKTDTTENK
jgi:hypothetical protein